MSKTLEELKLAIVEGDDEVAPEKAQAALAEGVAPVDIMQQAVVAGIEEAGRLWADNKYFLPDVILSAGAFKAAAEIIQPKLAEARGPSKGRILLGVVQGDMHDLGKTIVIAMLAGGGFEVIDLGVDVPVQTFVDKVAELKPDIVGLGVVHDHHHAADEGHHRRAAEPGPARQRQGHGGRRADEPGVRGRDWCRCMG